MVEYIFIDIDGVLNNQEAFDNGYCSINYSCVKAFNKILNAFPYSKIVISSSWRYLIISRQMTLTGFESMLLTYGLDVHGRVVGHTRKDNRDSIHDDTRYDQILSWVLINKCKNWIVLDDLFISNDLNFYKIDPETGLTMERAEEIISLNS